MNNPWQQETAEVKSNFSLEFETISDETVYKSLAGKIVDNKKFEVYQTISTRVIVKKDTGFQSNNKEITIFYFDETGVLVKSESNTESTYKAKDDPASDRISKETKSSYKKIKIIEIDSDIKIEVPQIG